MHIHIRGNRSAVSLFLTWWFCRASDGSIFPRREQATVCVAISCFSAHTCKDHKKKQKTQKTFICDNHLNYLKLWTQMWGLKPNKCNKKHTCSLNAYLVQLLSFPKPPPPLPRHHSTPWITPVLSLPPSFSTSFITHHSHLTALTHSRCFNLEWTRLF